jgi:hypothetical protein
MNIAVTSSTENLVLHRLLLEKPCNKIGDSQFMSQTVLTRYWLGLKFVLHSCDVIVITVPHGIGVATFRELIRGYHLD